MKNASHISKQDKILNDNVPENALMFPEQYAGAKNTFIRVLISTSKQYHTSYNENMKTSLERAI